jgi:hypothetical protein
MKHLFTGHRRPALLALAVLMSCLSACSSDDPAEIEDPPPPTPDTVLSGRLDTDGLAGAALAAEEDGLVLLALRADGVVEDTYAFPAPLDGIMPFDVTVAAGQDYVLEFRTGGADGPTFAVLVVDPLTGTRVVFEPPTGMGEIELGVITIDAETMTALSADGQDLAARLPAPMAAFRNLDGDLLPDVFDRDDDNDGVPDVDDTAPTLVRYSLDGGLINLAGRWGDVTARVWSTGVMNLETGSFTLESHGTPRFALACNVSPLLLADQFAAWLVSPVEFDADGRITGCCARISDPNPVRLTWLPDADGAGTPGYGIVKWAFEQPVPGQADTLTCAELAAVADDPVNAENWMATAWLWWEVMQQVQLRTRVLMEGYKFCIMNKEQLMDERLEHGRDIVVAGDDPPGPLAPGSVTYGWQDEDGNGDAGPGDSFTVTFADCWFENAGIAGGAMLDGRIAIRYCIDTQDEFGQVWMGAQFIVYEDLELAPLRDAGSGLERWVERTMTANSTDEQHGYGGQAFWVFF